MKTVSENFSAIKSGSSEVVGDGTKQQAKHTKKYKRFKKKPENNVEFKPSKVSEYASLYFYSNEYQGDFSRDGEIAIQYKVSPETNVCLKDHLVYGRYFFPTDAYIEMIVVACKTYFNVKSLVCENVTIVNPVIGRTNASNYLVVVFRKHQDGLMCFVQSNEQCYKKGNVGKVHLRCFIRIVNKRQSDIFKAFSIISMDDKYAFNVEKYYSGELNIKLGLFYRSLKKLTFGKQYAIGEIKLERNDERFLLNPSVVSAALASAMSYGPYKLGGDDKIGNELFLPYQIERLQVFGTLVGRLFTSFVEVKNITEKQIELFVEIRDESNKVILAFNTLKLQRVSLKVVNNHYGSVNEVKSVSLDQVVENDVSVHEASGKVGELDLSLDIAVIGMSCRYPRSKNVDAFWEVIKNGIDCITEVPEGRWEGFDNWYDPDPKKQHTSYSRWGGFIDDVDKFDSLFFNIAPSDAELMDPQQRVFLEEAWKTIESAGYSSDSLGNKKCGVFVGCAASDYGKLLAMSGLDTAGQTFMGTSNAILAARVSYFLNLKGPSLSVDTACSSSLTAIHLACMSIHNGDSDFAIAGGVNLFLTPLSHILTSQVGMQSMEGRCFTFDEAANGTVFSEGCGVVLLKPYAQAEKDGDPILGVVKASGVNQDGKTNGITAPSSLSQEELISRIYKKYNINAENITYVEAHGTATPLGDPIEVQALTSAFRQSTLKKQYCAISSVKTNIGHCSYSAGVAGFIKVLLCMKHKKYTPTVHYKKPNEHIEFDESPFFVSKNCEDWEVADGQARVAAISSFGFSGANAHIVLEEYNARRGAEKQLVESVKTHECIIIPLSAKTKNNLMMQATELSKYLRNNYTANQSVEYEASTTSLDKSYARNRLIDIAYTLQIGRDAMDERVAFTVCSMQELLEKLDAFVGNKSPIDGCYQGHIEDKNTMLSLFSGHEELNKVMDDWVRKGRISNLLNLWVNGASISWENLYTNTKPRKVSLPTYPFSRERNWITRINDDNKCGSKIHPLVHKNDSDLFCQRYSSTFNGSEYYFLQNIANGKKRISEIAYCEMARAAIIDALGKKADIYTSIELVNIRWVTDADRLIHPTTIYVEIDKIQIRQNGEVESASYKIVTDYYGSSKRTILAQGTGQLTQKKTEQEVRIAEVLKQTTHVKLNPKQCDKLYSLLELDCTPSQMGVQSLYLGDHQALLKHKLPEYAYSEQSFFVLHPVIMNLAFQTAMALLKGINKLTEADVTSKMSGNHKLPKIHSRSIERIEILKACPGQLYSWIRYYKAIHSPHNMFHADMVICDEKGNICINVVGYELALLFEDADNCNDETRAAQLTRSDSCQTMQDNKLEFCDEVWVKNEIDKASVDEEETLVCFLSDSKLQNQFSSAIKNVSQTIHIIFVVQGSKYAKCSESCYEVSINDNSCINQVFEDIRRKVKRVGAIYYMWPLEDKAQNNNLEFINSLAGYFSTAECPSKRLFLLGQMNNNLDMVTFGRWFELKEAYSEGLSDSNIEVILYQSVEKTKAWGMGEWASNLLNEMLRNESTSVLYRDEIRYERTLQTVPGQLADGSPIKFGGSYLIIGANVVSDSLCHALTEHLVKSGAASVTLLGSDNLSDDVECKIRELNRSGGEIKYVYEEYYTIGNIEKYWQETIVNNGKLNGVICLENAELQFENINGENISDNQLPELQSSGYSLFSTTLEDQELDFICYMNINNDQDQLSLQNIVSIKSERMANVIYLKNTPSQSEFFTKKVVFDWRSGITRPSNKFNDEGAVSSIMYKIVTELFDDAIAQEHVNNFTVVMRHIHYNTYVDTKIGTENCAKDFIVTKSNNRLALPIREEIKTQEPRFGDLSQDISEDLKLQIYELLKVGPERFYIDSNFADIGFDSIRLTEFAHCLSNYYGIEISPTILFGNSSIKQLADFLLSEYKSRMSEFYAKNSPVLLQEEDNSSNAKPDEEDKILYNEASLNCRLTLPASRTTQNKTTERIAVVGMSGKFPKADNLKDFWENLKSGKDCISEVPHDRWDWEEIYSESDAACNKTDIKWGGFIDGIAEFDPEFFGISSREAELMDPQQRLLLTYTYHAIEDAGYDPKSLAGKNVAVFMATANSGYGGLIEKAGDVIEAYTATGTQPSVGPNRISFILDLRGPSEPIETACASSLLAIRRGITAINDGCDMAIVGGVNVLLTPFGHIAYKQAGMLSKDGRCKTFSSNANGFVRSEGVGILVLKALHNAEKDGDHIYGLICGSAESHSGRSNTLTTPNPIAQTQLLESAYKNANIDPRTITYIETHGTGTHLGDAIEVDGIKSAFNNLIENTNANSANVTSTMPKTRAYCGLGSVKTNIGHAELASGVASVIKVLLQFKYKTLVKTLHTEPSNPYIQLEATPFYVVNKEQQWLALEDGAGIPLPRRAGVSSMGMGGVNAHVILEEYVAHDSDEIMDNYSLLAIFSAATYDQLKKVAQQMLAHIAADNEISLANLVYTLQVGRNHQNVRLAVEVSSIGELILGLEQFLGDDRFVSSSPAMDIYLSDGEKGEFDINRLFSDTAGQRFIQRLLEENDLEKLAQLWIRGAKIPWEKLYAGKKPRRISLPGYPFSRKRYWVPAADKKCVNLLDINACGNYSKNPIDQQNSKKNATQSYLYANWFNCSSLTN